MFQKHFLFLLGISLLLYSSCQKPLDSTSISPIESRVLLKVSYDMETISINKTSSKSDDPLDIVGQYPHIDKNHVEMTLYRDNKYKIETVILKPSQEFSSTKLGLPNPDPKVTRTILDDNQMLLYKDDGSIEEFEVSPIDVSHLVEVYKTSLEGKDIKALNNALASFQTSSYRDGLDDLLKNPDKYGATIDPVGKTVQKGTEDVVTITLPDEDENGLTGNSIVLLVDTEENILYGTRLYDSSDEILDSSLYAYDGNNNTLSNIFSVSKVIFPSGIEGTNERSVVIEDLEIEIN